ncbi:hypothetical protein TNCV_5043271 [Trichonephila clavipes]|nr:hypothetical protein TNCV_5043271 [Trichonephila clavipes]
MNFNRHLSPNNNVVNKKKIDINLKYFLLRGRNKQEERPVRSNQATTRRPCPYYLRSRVKKSEGIPEEQRSIEINGIPHSRIRRSLSMKVLDGDPIHRRI